MVFFKSFFTLFFFLMILFFSFLGSWESFALSEDFNFSFCSKVTSLNFTLVLDSNSFLFLFMVSLVTCMVLMYSEFYMDFYSNKKFIISTFIFFFFMSSLCLGGSLMNFMFGWDGLGISSLFLIMFYPNKTTLFNSFLTFFFNRLSDLIMMFVLSFHFFYFSWFYFLNDSYNYFFLSVLLFCLLTKSAQFPFSSWLPAAMSAPTPISAMVHSSTLVTAGIFLLFKTFFYLHSSGLFLFLLLVSVSTFFMGGLLANAEFDFKKIVAFSTMSQISMILFFTSLLMLNLSLLHTFAHALFKTLLFCASGALFIFSYGDQLHKSFRLTLGSASVSCFFLLSIFSMSGLVFSSSFFTKDLVMEFFLEEKNFSFFLFILVGGVLTILYSSKLFKSMSSFSSFKKMFYMKSSNFWFLFFFSGVTLSCMKLFQDLFFFNLNCIVSSLELIFLNFFFFFSFLFKGVYMKPSGMNSLEVFFTKYGGFSIFKKIFSLTSYDTFLNDSFFFKPSSFKVLKWSNTNFSKKSIFFLLSFLLFFL